MIAGLVFGFSSAEIAVAVSASPVRAPSSMEIS